MLGYIYHFKIIYIVFILWESITVLFCEKKILAMFTIYSMYFTMS